MAVLPLKILLAGSPKLAVPAFQAILKDNRFQVVGLLTQPDQPAGRGLKLTPPPAKVWAMENNLPVWQPEKLKVWLPVLAEINPEVVVVIAYGKLIPKALLELPKYGWINVHGSLLPKYRGAGVLSAPIINGDKQTGVSIMKLVKELDAGPVVVQEDIILTDNETMGSLASKIGDTAAAILPNTLVGYIEGQLVPQPQDDSQASYVGLVATADAKIDWHQSAVEIGRLIRAMQPAPGAWTTWRDQRLKIVAAQLSTQAWLNPGKVGLVDGQLAIGTSRGALIISRLQLAGRQAVSGAEFLIGQADILGEYLT
ncbi:methionyl-tRNA formyltransferase [Candidatus Falkowbacteria bacterium]|nr:methionyl-tRNA formyltransferase [Candidatus Falkowbacteria bacterium]